MLYNVSEGMQGMALQVVRNHPNAWDVQVLRKVVTRPDETGTMGGAPNMGGIGVLDSQDENQYTYEWLCNAHALKAEQYQPGNMTDLLDAAIGGAEEFLYMLAPAKEAGESIKTLGFKTKDVVLFVLGIGPEAARAAYEIASVDATCELPPHLPRYVLNRRADMDLPAGMPEDDDEDLDGDDQEPSAPAPEPEPGEGENTSETPDLPPAPDGGGNTVSSGDGLGQPDWLSD